jgi:alcohol dehydrogenase class IV
MGCCHGYALTSQGDPIFSIEPASVAFGPGALGEVGDHLRGLLDGGHWPPKPPLGARRVALFTDQVVAELPPVDTARRALATAGLDCVVYDSVHVEPTDASFLAAAAFAREGRFDGYVSVGGGSVIDTCKAAMLYATYPAEFAAYVNRPIGEGREVPGPLPPHLACPTTTGTGSECTGIAVFDDLARKAKTGIVSRRLRPAMAIVDPTAAATLPASVVAASGFDVLCHALESYSARPFTHRPRPSRGDLRPMSQGRNPWSDMGCRAALKLAGRYLVRAVRDASDAEAREGMAWAATLAGIAFGNAGVHLPHAMSYAVSGHVRDFRMPGYPDEPLVPHGVSVVVSAPAVFRLVAGECPERLLEAAAALGADARGASAADAGEILSAQLVAMMRATGIPNGVGGVGYGAADLPALVAGTVVQTRLLDNAPRAITADDLRALFQSALRCW